MSVVRSNINSMNANRNLSKNNNMVAKSLEKLASGYQINRAADDASGLAISEKMKSQIEGLKQASENSQDGISLVKVAEGALNEIHSMLNRMTELSVQASNGTINDEVDREAIQAEFEVLCDEIDRVSQSTNFNGIYVFEGQVEEYSYDVLTQRQVALSDIDVDRDNVYDVPGLDIRIIDGVLGIDFLVNQDTGDIVVTSNTPLVIEGTDVSSITIKTDNAVLALGDGASIESLNSSAINVGNNNLTLYLEGNSTVTSANGCGIEVGATGSLTIQGPGSTDVTGSGDNAAIGSLANTACGSIIINSGSSIKDAGVVTATSTGNGAAIGSGAGGSVYGDLVMMSGIINAIAGGNGAAIGSGEGGSVNGNLVVTGDNTTVNATATSGAAIGSGANGNFIGTLAIIGGTTNAEATSGAAIGSGAGGKLDGTLVIDGSSTIVTATADSGAAIGCGSNGVVDGDIVILDAKKITATATSGAGIGTGADSTMTGDIGIVGGNITANATTGAAIGTGTSSTFTGNIQIKDATIKAEATSGAAIGSGASSKFTGNIEITQSDDDATTINATAVNGAAIGSGATSTFEGNIIITGGDDITAKTTGNGAAIGTGYNSSFSTGSEDDDGNAIGGIQIKDADITATAEGSGAAIGSGYGSSSKFTGNIEITQSAGEKTTINATAVNGAAIGSGYNSTFAGDIIITGGDDIKAKTTGDGAAIGSGYYSTFTGSKDANGDVVGGILIKDATITAIAESSSTTVYSYNDFGVSAAIGSGCYSTFTADIIITETVGAKTDITAIGTDNGTAIGSGYNYNGTNGEHTGDIVIAGGTINAINNSNGSITSTTGGSTAAIGVADVSKMTGDIIITGSDTIVNAYGGADGAGIGTGRSATLNGDIIIEGGTTTATTVRSAGIGTGSSGTLNGSIVITGGDIEATGGSTGAGIGTGAGGEIGTTSESGIIITGGNVDATGGTDGGAGIGTGTTGTIYGNVTVTGGNVVADGGDGGAGIGTGVGTSATTSTSVIDGEVNVTGGSVNATAGGGSYTDSNGDPILAEDVGKGVYGDVNEVTTYADASIPLVIYDDDFDVDFDVDFDFGYGFTPPSIPDIDESEITGYVTVTDVTTMFREHYNLDDLILQVGDTNDMYQKVSVPIISMRHTEIGLTGTSMSTEEQAGASLQLIKDAISYVSEHRSALGAIQNRLEYTVNNLNNAVENISASNSRIRDTDMAEQMMQYTKMGVLVQSAQTMLTKSNEEAQGVLNLLG